MQSDLTCAGMYGRKGFTAVEEPSQSWHRTVCAESSVYVAAIIDMVVIPRQRFIHPDGALQELVNLTYTSSTLSFYLNGTKIALTNPNPRWTLLDFIRSQDGLKGTKLGCGEGGCGACTVVLQTKDTRRNSRKIRHLAINACLYPLAGG